MTQPLNPLTDCVIVADLGPNPAPLSELIWALYRQRNLRVKAVFLTTYDDAHVYLASEFLDSDAALDQLRAVLGPGILTYADVYVERVYAEGVSLNDEVTQAQTLAWSETRWRSALQAQKAAGEAPVIFALIGGRRRTMSAQQAVLFQLLARPQDLCIDVRVNDPRVEGGTGFFFPEQAQQRVKGKHGGQVIAAEVEVILIDVPVPRLRALIPASALTSHQAALAASNSALTAATPPRVVLDYATQIILVNDEELKLSTPQLIWYATLLARRATNINEGWVRADELQAIEQTIDMFEACAVKPFNYERSSVLHDLFSDPQKDQYWKKIISKELDFYDNLALRKLRTDTKKRIQKAFEGKPFSPLITPFIFSSLQAKQGGYPANFRAQRITLDPSCIECRPHNAFI